MPEEASVAIVIRARDEASQAFQGVQRSLGQVSQRIEGTRVSTVGGTSAFSMMKGMLLPLAGGLLSAAGAFKALKTSVSETSDATAAATFQARLLGDAHYENLQRIFPQLIDLGYQFGLTEAESLKMFSAMQRGSRRADISIEQVTDSMRISNRMQKEATETAYAYGRALDGSIEELRTLTGVQWATRESAVAVSKAMEDQRDWFDRLGDSVERLVEKTRQRPLSLLEMVLPKGPLQRLIPPGEMPSLPSLVRPTLGEMPSLPSLVRPTPGGGMILNLNVSGDLVVDTEERKSQLQREIRDGIDQINRGTR